MTRKIIAALSAAILLSSFAGCIAIKPIQSGEGAQAVSSAPQSSTTESDQSQASSAPANNPALTGNSKTGSVKSQGVLKIELDYQVGEILVVPAENDEISYEEVSTLTDPASFSTISTEGTKVSIKQGNIGKLVNGDITITLYIPSSYAGELDIDGDIGEVKIDDTFNLSTLDISMDLGSIAVSGVGAKKYDLDADTGEIALTLPADLSFSYQVSTSVGDVRSDFFDTTGGTKNITGKELKGVVGDNPTAVVELDTDIGEISLMKD